MDARRLLVFISGLIAASATFAFGSGGHGAVGRMAETLLLDTRALTEIRGILHPGESLAFAAEWADCARNVGDDRKHHTPEPKYRTKACTWYEKTLSTGPAELEAYVGRNWDNCEYAGALSHCHKSFHFTNVPLQLGRYVPTSVGATRTDIVQAMRAAVLLLRDDQHMEPFQFSDGIAGRREALRLLAHLVGDIHQPLHVGSVYLAPSGRVINPNKNKLHGKDAETHGGNELVVPGGSLHTIWDSVDTAVTQEDLTGEAASIEETAGRPEEFAELWANESVLQARIAFRQLRFTAKDKKTKKWSVVIKDPIAYAKARQEMQRLQVIRAGTRLAELLQAIWPD